MSALMGIVTSDDTFAMKTDKDGVAMQDLSTGAGFQVPECARDYLRAEGFVLPLDAMDGWIATWDDWMAARGEFYDYRDTDAVGRVYAVHRRSIKPAMRVCQEWGSLLLNEKMQVVCEEQACTDWLEDFFTRTGFKGHAQSSLVRAFGLGTGAWALWVDTLGKKQQIRTYDARMVIPLTWDAGEITECAFVTRSYYRGAPVDQLQMHLVGTFGYEIKTVCFDQGGEVVEPDGVMGSFCTFSPLPTFAIIKPAVENTRVDMSPYGQSVFADAIDAMQAVDLSFDAIYNEVDMGKMRVFLSDVMFDVERDGGKSISIPFGKGDCTVFRKVMSTEDTIQEFAPALRTAQQVESFRLALQMLGDMCGFGIGYFDIDNAGYVKTATEVSADNSALMRNIRKHENLLEKSLVQISRAAMAVQRYMAGDGGALPCEGDMHVVFDDSIVTDTASEKASDMVEVGVTMQPWEYRMKWYGEDEKTAKRNARGLGATGVGKKAAVAPGGSQEA